MLPSPVPLEPGEEGPETEGREEGREEGSPGFASSQGALDTPKRVVIGAQKHA